MESSPLFKPLSTTHSPNTARRQTLSHSASAIPYLSVGVSESMDPQKGRIERPSSSAAVVTSCRKKKNEEATFIEDLKDHIDEFIHASMDEHKTCFKKTVQKMFGLSKAVAEKDSNAAKEVESSLPLQTTLQD